MPQDKKMCPGWPGPVVFPQVQPQKQSPGSFRTCCHRENPGLSGSLTLNASFALAFRRETAFFLIAAPFFVRITVFVSGALLTYPYGIYWGMCFDYEMNFQGNRERIKVRSRIRVTKKVFLEEQKCTFPQNAPAQSVFDLPTDQESQ